MKVLLVANYIPDRQRSMARYAQILHDELLKRGFQSEILRPPAILSRLVASGSGLFRWLGYIDKYLLFPPRLWLRARRADIVHICDHSNSMYLRWAGRTPGLITAHDALAIRSALGHFPQNPTRRSGILLQRWILGSLRNADRIVCVSDKTRADFAALLPGGPPMSVVPNPPSDSFYPASSADVARARAELGLTPQDEYLLHVGKDNWYKNRPGVLRLMAELRKHPRFCNVKLVMAGAALPPSLQQTARSLQAVIECVSPHDDLLRALYTGALALLFPSLEEGFGWPILEAQACGCPVITTARPPMSEVAGPAAILIDPAKAVEAANIIAARFYEPDPKLEALRSAALENARAYSVESSMEGYLAIYRQLAADTD